MPLHLFRELNIIRTPRIKISSSDRWEHKDLEEGEQIHPPGQGKDKDPSPDQF